MYSDLATYVFLASLLVSLNATPIVLNESPVKLSMFRHLNVSAKHLLKASQERAQLLRTRSQLPKPDFNVTKAEQNAAAVLALGITNELQFYREEVYSFYFVSK